MVCFILHSICTKMYQKYFWRFFFVQPLSGSLFNQIRNMWNSKICSQYVDNENAIVIKVLTVKKRDNVTILNSKTLVWKCMVPRTVITVLFIQRYNMGSKTCLLGSGAYGIPVRVPAVYRLKVPVRMSTVRRSLVFVIDKTDGFSCDLELVILVPVRYFSTVLFEW